MKILITEDHELYRDGLRLLLQEAFADIHIFESGDFPTTLSILKKHRDIALVLLDIHIPGTQGLQGLSEIKQAYPALPVVIVSMVDYQFSIQQMLQLGADGFISKTSEKSAMVEALRNIMAGEQVILGSQKHACPTTLTPRQIETLRLLSRGMTNKEIATELQISPTTVREHVSGLLALFACENRTQVVLKARQAGFILD